MRNLLIMSFVSLLIIQTNLFAQSSDTIPIGYIQTKLGEVYIELDYRTPRHQNSFIQLAEAGYWDSLTFNRVIPNFVAQGGCPDTPEGFNDPDFLLKPEFHPDLTHKYGAVGAGRDNNPDKLSARCQFYIVQNTQGLHRLDGDYTVFGKVIKGMDVVDKIVHVERDSDDQPLTPITMKVSMLYLNLENLAQLKNDN